MSYRRHRGYARVGMPLRGGQKRLKVRAAVDLARLALHIEQARGHS